MNPPTLKPRPGRDEARDKPRTPDPPAEPPPPVRGVRFEGPLVAGERALAKFDGWMSRRVPEDVNPLAQTGRAANLALLVAVATGILLLIWYTPSVEHAYSSLESIRGRTAGGLVRAMHRYSSDLTMLLLFVHATRMLFARKFTGARRLPWVTGVLLLALVWFIGWTGYWLVWDRPAQQVAVGSMQFLDALPIFGEPMTRQFLADRLVPSLLFFVIFFFHMLLPLGIAAGLVMHLSRLNRVRLLPNRWLAGSLVAGLVVAAVAVPAPLDEPAAMAVKAEAFTVDAWYLAPLALTLRFQGAGLWLCVALVAGFAAVPWLLGRRIRKETVERDPAQAVTPWQTVVRQTRCHACTQCVRDCPFDAVEMIARSDGKPFATRAWVDPDRCVGCGVCVGSCDSEAMSFTWPDVLAEEARIEAGLRRARERDGESWLALVAADIEGGSARFRQDRWQRDLPGYVVAGVPTASWVRTKFVEKVLREGAKGVLVVRDARLEAAARDGNRWIADRLAGTRKPSFRPKRAGGANENAWRVVDFNPADRAGLRAEAREFRGAPPTAKPTSARRPGKAAAVLAAPGLALGLIAASVAPSHLRVTNPAPPDPELIFSFNVLGEMQEIAEPDAEANQQKPVHMRGRSTEKPRRQPVSVRITVDGVTGERTFEAKGISDDGPAIGDWHRTLSPGPRSVAIEIDRGPQSEPLKWSGTIDAAPRRRHVITYTPADGFVVE
jgi:quinol-cytochrome oxidoreductase complex cytochrome b subunit